MPTASTQGLGDGNTKRPTTQPESCTLTPPTSKTPPKRPQPSNQNLGFRVTSDLSSSRGLEIDVERFKDTH